ncbi:4a-hydroxytetrahydrobiopterin dehydratase [Tibeticola sp.]|jgi:pterin-4a-carbinolamine dehydratase|uniref:4a-hydroxytetrahydrobiopterin dehydratase n=1 Tax=Tibeticola sp. TaxID=2005368 RepID=UPI0025F4089B|nr:4a-hydroxytetrahydrobiopterin dehydratase [Tibeticola sp.]
MAELKQTDWREQGKPPTLFKRFAFDSYSQTRAFLDALAALAEETGQHPQNINFGTTYVNLTLDALDGKTLGDTERAFAARIDALVQGS